MNTSICKHSLSPAQQASKRTKRGLLPVPKAWISNFRSRIYGRLSALAHKLDPNCLKCKPNKTYKNPNPKPKALAIKSRKSSSFSTACSFLMKGGSGSEGSGGLGSIVDLESLRFKCRFGVCIDAMDGEEASKGTVAETVSSTEDRMF
ncbi:unnamed protein product [Dovyalis caffra]|uniref:Uncharacterized protein n=1 Tax=Dovyalis caffra TaxID=77055 RepID=A0AAV1QSH2_9ROSI|nr:unnamed protein product [Dovyalis caffra]